MYHLQLTDSNPVVTGLTMNTIEDKRKAYNAITKQDGKVSELVGSIVDVANFHCSLQKYVNEEDGTVNEYVKTILILQDGSSYYAKSAILFRAVCNFIEVFGMPSEWDGVARFKIVMDGKGYGLDFKGFV